MFKSKIESLYRKKNNARLYQGDIFKDLKFVTGDPEKATEKDIISLTYAVVLSQDCDLESDFKCRKTNENQDKFLLSLLISPAFILESFAKGEHLGGWRMNAFNNRQVDSIKNNDSFKRYHYLKGEPSFSVPELVIDFKHFFSLPRDFLYKEKKNKYVASLNEIFREELSQRFSNYLSRIGLPELPVNKKQ
ncbi:MAG: hypothetical protein Q8N68_01355 [bacterium]|nr:hypothetical protein [bacterium]